MLKPQRKLIGTMEVATKLGVHPMSIPRLVRKKKGFPQPIKPFNKNLWPEDIIDAYLGKLLAEKRVA